MTPRTMTAASPARVHLPVPLPVPGLPDPTHVVLTVEEQMSLTLTDLWAVRRAVSGFPVPWFDAVDQHKYDCVGGNRWTYGYVEQVSGPFVANFTITRDRSGYAVGLDNGNRTTSEWKGFPTLAGALAAIWKHVEEKLRMLGVDFF